MLTTSVIRCIAATGLLGLTGGCDLVMGIPDLGSPANLTGMTTRFKARIKAEEEAHAPIDLGARDSRIWHRFMGPRTVAFCGRPIGAPAAQRTYQINFYRGSFGTIGELAVETPAHSSDSPSYGICGSGPGG